MATIFIDKVSQMCEEYIWADAIMTRYGERHIWKIIMVESRYYFVSNTLQGSTVDSSYREGYYYSWVIKKDYDIVDWLEITLKKGIKKKKRKVITIRF